jgi:hypothetical protein
MSVLGGKVPFRKSSKIAMEFSLLFVWTGGEEKGKSLGFLYFKMQTPSEITYPLV